MTMQVLIELQDAEGGRQRYTLSPGQYYLGKADTCAILLNDPHVSRHHATLEVSDTDVILTDNNSTNGTWFENQRILNPILLQAGDVLRMGTMTLVIVEAQVSHAEATASDHAHAQSPLDAGLQDDALDAYPDASDTLPDPLQPSLQVAQETETTENPDVAAKPSAQAEPSVAIDPALSRAPVESPLYYEAAPATNSPNQAATAASSEKTETTQDNAAYQQIPTMQAQYAAQVSDSQIIAGPAGKSTSADEHDPNAMRNQAEQLISSLNPMFMEGISNSDKAAFQQKVIATAQQMVARELERIDQEIRRRPSGPKISDANLDLVSFGDLQALMDDDQISQIMVNGLNGVFVDRQGHLEQLKFQFDGQDAIEKLIFKIIAPLGYDPSNVEPMLDIPLPDGSHLNIVFPPIAAEGPLITIRKAQKMEFRAEHFLHYGSCAQQMLQFLARCIAKRRNIVITGAAQSGKTACLNVLTHIMNPIDRVVVVEDVPELAVDMPHAIHLQAGQARLQGLPGLNTQLLLNNAFSMRPDRIALGEFHGHTALDTLLAMNTGQCGFCTTFQAHSPHDLIRRIALGVMMRQPDLPTAVVYDQISTAVNIVVTMTRFPDDTRKISDIAEVVGVENGKPEVKSVFRFLPGGVNEQGLVWGRYQATGYIPSFYRLTTPGEESEDLSIFRADQEPTEAQHVQSQ